MPTAVDPSVNNVAFNSITVRRGAVFTTTLTGANLNAEIYFDVRFRAPGATSDEVALNWQQGTIRNRTIDSTTLLGLWRVTGVRAHRDPNDHSAAFIPVSASLTVVP